MTNQTKCYRIKERVHQLRGLDKVMSRCEQDTCVYKDDVTFRDISGARMHDLFRSFRLFLAQGCLCTE